MAEGRGLRGGRGRWLLAVSLFLLVATLSFAFWPQHDHLETLRTFHPGEVVWPKDGAPVTSSTLHGFAFSQDCSEIQIAFEDELTAHKDVVLSAQFLSKEVEVISYFRKEFAAHGMSSRRAADPPDMKCYAVVQVRREPAWIYDAIRFCRIRLGL